jgi:hypothetical protein
MAKKSEKQKAERNLVPLMAYLPRDVEREVRRVAEEQGRRVGNMARRMIEEWLDEHAAVGAAR